MEEQRHDEDTEQVQEESKVTQITDKMKDAGAKAMDKTKDVVAKIASAGVTKSVVKTGYKFLAGLATAVGEGLAEARMELDQRALAQQQEKDRVHEDEV